MTRKDVYKEIEQTAGFVPTFFEKLSDQHLEHEWRLFKNQLTAEGPIPPKYRELMGVAVAASMQCPYCIYAHTQFAKAFGATEQELENAVHTAKHTAGWSTYIAGLDTKLDQFKGEIDKVVGHMRKNR